MHPATAEPEEMVPAAARTKTCAGIQWQSTSQMQQHRKSSIGNTQQKFKARTQQHFDEVQKLIKIGKKLDSC